MILRSLVYLNQLRRNLRVEPSKLRELQLKKLKYVIRNAYENVSFYHRKMDGAGVKPGDIQSLEDLKKIPCTTKSEVQKCSTEDVVARNVDVTKCIRKTTSGSTGMPLTIVADRASVDFEEALVARALLENGLSYTDKMLVVSDPRSFPKGRNWIQHFGISRRKYVSIFESEETQLETLKKYEPDAVKGYLSSIALLADACRRGNVSVRLRLVFTSAELLDSESRRLMELAFGTRPIDSYACYEFGLLAWECQEHSGYHMNVDSTVMEFLDGDEPFSYGESGEIVCTRLFNDSMPLIRYRLGDVGIPAEEHCSCGVTFPSMKIVEGRSDDFVRTVGGVMISPMVFSPFPFEIEDFDRIVQFRVVQEKMDHMIIQMVLRGQLLEESEVLSRAERRMKELFGKEVCVEFEFVNELEKEPSGKLRKVVSHVTSTGK